MCPVQDASGAKALADFVGGAGDVLISYENEAIYAQAKNQPVDYVIPSDTLLIENPIACHVDTKHPHEAKAFVDFLYSQAGQQIFADIGYRPVLTRCDVQRRTRSRCRPGCSPSAPSAAGRRDHEVLRPDERRDHCHREITRCRHH